jgi:hypothetical protein
MTKILIHVSQQILIVSQLCGTNKDFNSTGHAAIMQTANNCAIALAVRDIFPKASVLSDRVYPLGYMETLKEDDYKPHRHIQPEWEIGLPLEAQSFITKFDNLKSTPQARTMLPELTFTIHIKDSLLEKIVPLTEVYGILRRSKNLLLITNPQS